MMVNPNLSTGGDKMKKAYTMTRAEWVAQLVAEVKDHAYRNYENGWDSLIECHTDEEITRAIGRAYSINGAIKNVDRELGIMYYAEVRADIQAA